MIATRSSAAVATLTLAGLAAAGAPETETFEITTAPLSIFGLSYSADYLGPATGFITQSRAELTFQSTGSFDAADLLITFQAPSEGVPLWQFSGADLGWSGQGTFKASLSTTELNGLIDLGDPPPDFGLYLIDLRTVEGGALGGQFLAGSRFEVDIDADGPPAADVTGDGLVNVDDLVAVIVNWGACPAPCPPDIDRNGSVDVDDLVAVIVGWS